MLSTISFDQSIIIWHPIGCCVFIGLVVKCNMLSADFIDSHSTILDTILIGILCLLVVILLVLIILLLLRFFC